MINIKILIGLAGSKCAETHTQLQNAPVVTCGSLPTRLPTVHPFPELSKHTLLPYRRLVLYHVLTHREKVVCGEEDFTSNLQYKLVLLIMKC